MKKHSHNKSCKVVLQMEQIQETAEQQTWSRQEEKTIEMLIQQTYVSLSQ